MTAEELRALVEELKDRRYDLHTAEDVVAFLEHRAWELAHGLAPCNLAIGDIAYACYC